MLAEDLALDMPEHVDTLPTHERIGRMRAALDAAKA